MSLYHQSFNRMRDLIETFDWIKLKIINKKNGPPGGIYDFETKKLTVNKYNYQPHEIILLLIHQFNHAMQDANGYFNNENVKKRVQFQYDLFSRNKTYSPIKHKKYLNEILKLEYDCQKRCYNFIKQDQIISSYLNTEYYINDINFYMLQIKYSFLTRGYYNYKDNRFLYRPGINNKIMTTKKLLRPLNKCQLQYMNKNKR